VGTDAFVRPASEARQRSVGLSGWERARKLCYSFVLMEIAPKTAPEAGKPAVVLYCPVCAEEINDPLTCGDCSAIICRRCGTPLESPDELGMG